MYSFVGEKNFLLIELNGITLKKMVRQQICLVLSAMRQWIKYNSANAENKEPT